MISQDDILLNKLSELVLTNLENEQFGVEDLSEQLGMSRSHLHRKLKHLKGVSISQYIRDIRLEQAEDMLRNNVATVSEIAYKVGFSSPSYFHRCFQEKYGCSPGEFKKSLEENEALQANIVVTDALKNEQIQSEVYHEVKSHLSSKNNKSFLSLKVISAAVIVMIITVSGYYFLNPTKQTYESIAFLPIQNLTGDPEQDYFANGLHDALIAEMGQISGLRVISRTSSMRYVNNSSRLQDIAKELGVNLLVEGAVMGSNNNVRIQLKLIEVFPQERNLWSKDYKQDLRNIEFLQSEMIKNIANEIHVGLTPEEEKKLAATKEIDPEAYKAYLKGMFHWNKLTENDLNLAMDYFDQALAIDSSYMHAYAGKSYVWTGRLQQGLTSYFEGSEMMQLQSLKEKTNALGNTPAELYYVLGTVSCWVEWEYEEAERLLKMALSLNPNHSAARAYLSHVLNILNKPEEAMEQIDMAIQLDPYNPLYRALYGMDLNFSRQFDKAISILGATLKTSPNDPVALSTLRTAYHMKGMEEEALEIWKTSYAAKNDFDAVEALIVGEKEGGYSGALENLAQYLIDRSETTYVTPWQIGTLYTRAGNVEKAVLWLEKAYYAHDSNMPYICIDPIFDVLRNDTNFQKLIEKMRLFCSSSKRS